MKNVPEYRKFDKDEVMRFALILSLFIATSSAAASPKDFRIGDVWRGLTTGCSRLFAPKKNKPSTYSIRESYDHQNKIQLQERWGVPGGVYRYTRTINSQGQRKVRRKKLEDIFYRLPFHHSRLIGEVVKVTQLRTIVNLTKPYQTNDTVKKVIFGKITQVSKKSFWLAPIYQQGRTLKVESSYLAAFPRNPLNFQDEKTALRSVRITEYEIELLGEEYKERRFRLTSDF